MRKLILLLCLSLPLYAQDVLNRQLPVENNDANTLYNEQRFDEAREVYEKLLENDPDNGALAYNLANTYAALGDIEKAQEFYKQAMKSDHQQAKARSRFNKGTMDMSAQNPGEAVKAFSDYLRSNPDDIDAKRNLELALRMLEQQQQQQQEQNQDNQDQENEDQENQDQQQQQNSQQNQDDQQDQNSQDQQDQQNQQNQDDQQNQDQDNQDQQDQQNQQDQQGQNQEEQKDEQKKQDQSKEEALDEQVKQQILQAMDEQEKQQQKEYQKRKIGTVRRKAKDW